MHSPWQLYLCWGVHVGLGTGAVAPVLRPRSPTAGSPSAAMGILDVAGAQHLSLGAFVAFYGLDWIATVPIAETLGFALTRAEEGEVWFTGTPDESVYNPIGAVRGALHAARGNRLHAGGDQGQLPAPREGR